MSTLSATEANEIKNAILHEILIEKYKKIEASRKKAVIKYYNKKWKPDRETMTEAELAEFEMRRKERNEKAKARYYEKQEENKQRSKDRYYRLKKEAEENKIKLENLKINEAN